MFVKMRYIHLLIAGVFLSAGCKAQDMAKSFIEFTAGAGLPVGEFASKDNTITAGLAMTGIVINAEYNRYFKSNRLGLCIGVKRSVFPLDVDAWTNGNPNASSDPWRVFVAYGGLTFRKPIREQTILSTKLAIGLASSEYPEATITGYNSTGPVVYKFTSTTGQAHAFVLGASLRRAMSERIDVALSLDYLSTSPKFMVTQTLYSSQSSTSYQSPYTQNMQALTAGVSLAYKFIGN
jgi:hypothetical protein